MKAKVSLYPEKSRETLELDYHHMVAVAWDAAAELVRLEGLEATHEQCIRKLDQMMRLSADRAAKSAAVRAHRVLMTGAKPVVHLLIAAVLFGGACFGQRAATASPVDFALYAADATIRALDLTSTHALLASPCRCFHEDNPLAPHTGKVLPLVAFQAGMSYGAIEGGRRLAAHGHPRLGRFLLLADIAGEVWAVQHNYRQHEPAPKASGTALSPTPATVRIP